MTRFSRFAADVVAFGGGAKTLQMLNWGKLDK